MFLKTLCVVLVTLLYIPFNAYAESDSTSIGIKVEIKTTEQCHYSFDNRIDLSLSSNSFQSLCDLNSLTLQQQVSQVASLELNTTASYLEGEYLRVLMTVQ